MSKKKPRKRRDSAGQPFYVESVETLAAVAGAFIQFNAGLIDRDELTERLETISPAYRVPLCPSSATSAQPGSEEKIRVMAERFAAGRSIFHASDAKLSTLDVRPGNLTHEKESQRIKLYIAPDDDPDCEN